MFPSIEAARYYKELVDAVESYKDEAVRKYKEENDDWQKRYNQLELLLNRLTFDEKTRKAWLVAGDYQMLQFYMNEIRRKMAGLDDEKNSRR